MDRTKTYLSKTFLVTSNDARIRNPARLTEFQKPAPGEQWPAGALTPGGIKRIPEGIRVRISDHRVMATGASKKVMVFVQAHSEDGATAWGWTSAKNVKDEFINETLGVAHPPQGASSKGPFAAWEKGNFKKQVSLVTILDAGYELSYLSMDTLDHYFRLVEEAAAAGIAIKINSGFRSYPEQEALRRIYDREVKTNPRATKAAKAGWSNHQNGVAFDIPVAGANGNETYDWLCANAPRLGFLRTVNDEPWHWEYRPTDAAKALTAGTFKAPGVVDS